jgi:catechol 2,3-dioxygenase-like lactoylglutathione lyase family enzyme
MPENGTTGRVQTGHVGINVSELERSRDFYRRAFGFEVMTESWESGREFAFLGFDNVLVLTLWQQSTGRFDGGRPGLHHLSFHVPTIDDVRRAEARLRDMQVPLLYDGIVPHGEGAQSGGIYFEDPDGVRLEIYAPDAGQHHDAPTPGAPSCGFF